MRKAVDQLQWSFGNGQNQNFLTVIGLVAIGTSLSVETGDFHLPVPYPTASALIGPEKHPKITQ